MKLATVSLHKDFNDTWLDSLRQKMPLACPEISFTDIEQADAVVLRLINHPAFIFDHALAERIAKKPVIFLDFFEHGPKRLRDTIFGHLTPEDWELHPKRKEHTECQIFNDWIAAYPPGLHYRRELALNTQWKHVRPIEYLTFHLNDPAPEQSEAEFKARPIPIFFLWGANHPSRPAFHGYLIYQYALLRQQAPILTVEDLGHDCRRWCMIYTPEFLRLPMARVYTVQGQAKLSVSLAGAGQKCMRDAEASYNSVMARMEFGVQYTYPWIDGENCIILPTIKPDGVLLDCEAAFHKLTEALSRPDLYRLYRNGMFNWRNYCWKNYLPMLASQWTKI